jgi:hypothetical protein
MNSHLADPRTNRTQQLRLQARLKVRSHVNNLRFKCQTCNAVRMKKLLQQSSSDDDSGSESEGLETKGDNSDEEEEGNDPGSDMFGECCWLWDLDWGFKRIGMAISLSI